MNPVLTTTGKRIDEHRRKLVLGAAGASLAPLAGCGGDDVEKSNAYVDSVNIAQTRFAASFERLARDITSSSTPAPSARA